MTRALAAIGLLCAAAPAAGQGPPADRLSRAGVARAQAVVDSVFLDRRAPAGIIAGGDWASYLMARLGVEPFPDTTGIQVATDTAVIVISGRLQDLPQEARAMLGPIAALVDSSTVLAAEVEQRPAGQGLAHFRLRAVSVGGFPIPELVLHSMLLRIGERYPALTKSGRDLLVQIPADGAVALGTGVVWIRVAPGAPGASPP